jgi:cyclase
VLFLGRAHTGGDLSVYLPRDKVLFMSEAFLHRVFPAMRSAYPTEWVRTLERAQSMDVITLRAWARLRGSTGDSQGGA